jgi:hypothetical protein
MEAVEKEQTYTKAEVDAAVAEALRRVVRKLEMRGVQPATSYVHEVAHELGVVIPDE